MGMSREETMSYIEELKEELAARPTIEVESVKEVVISNSEIGGTNLGALFGALAKCQGEFKAVHKGSAAHAYNYADLQSVLEASMSITSKNGIAVTQMNVSKMMGKMTLVGVKTVLGHSEGGYVTSEIYIPTMKTKMNTLVQMAGVNMTYLRRYGLQAALGLATTDNDGSEK